MVTLQGRGGIGKTSLALEVLHQVAERDSFSAIIWFSARDIDLVPQAPRIVRADVLTTEDVARDFYSIMRPNRRLGSVSEALHLLTESLSGRGEDGPFIVVVDNFETIREQGELYTYLNNSIRLPNKVLITTRTRDFKADYPIEVRGMARDEYHVLVNETAARLNIGQVVDGQYEEQLTTKSDGHPYITKVLLGEVARERRQVGLKHVLTTKDTLLDALFDRSFAGLSPAAQRVFLTLCSWRSVVPEIGPRGGLVSSGERKNGCRSRAG